MTFIFAALILGNPNSIVEVGGVCVKGKDLEASFTALNPYIRIINSFLKVYCKFCIHTLPIRLHFLRLLY